MYAPAALFLLLANIMPYRVESLGSAPSLGRTRLLRQEEEELMLESEKRIEQRLEAKLLTRLIKLEEAVEELGTRAGAAAAPASEDAGGSRIPTKTDRHGVLHNLTLWERVRYLERKVDGSTNWLKDPQLYRREQYKCRNASTLGTDHHVCFDGWQRRPHHGCIVYDLGIWSSPEFGVNMMRQHGCKVRAYDPSPTSAKWWADQDGSAKDLKRPGSLYTFNLVGAGGNDGNLELFHYNWDQVSVVRGENDYTQRAQGASDEPPASMRLPVKTLTSMMRDNRDTYIDVLKIDIEGSEYMFLQDMFDRMGLLFILY
jgi:FkbM family methyltransferase